MSCQPTSHPLPLSLGSAVVARSAPEETVTSSFASFIHAVRPEHLTKTVRYRSKRMILDSIGVGLMGSTTPVFDIALQYCRVGTALFPWVVIVPTVTPSPQARLYFMEDVGLFPCSGASYHHSFTQGPLLNLPFCRSCTLQLP